MRRYIIYGIVCFTTMLYGTQIHQHWLTQSSIQPQKSQYRTYWILIPEYNDRALIQVASNQAPSYDRAQKTGNFIYVDPTYEHAGSGFHKLPTGLRLWQSDSIRKIDAAHHAKQDPSLKVDTTRLTPQAYIVRNFPHGQPFAQQKGKASAYISLSNGTTWQHQQQSTHPSGIGDTINNPRAMLTGDLRVVTANTLAQFAYKQHAKTTQMPLEMRQHHFRVAQSNPYIFWGTDMICAQEWDQSLAKGIQGYGFVGNQPKQGMTSWVFYDKQRWNKIDEEIVTHNNKDSVIATLSNGTTTITIVSCHNPSASQAQQATSTIQAIYKKAETQAKNNMSNGIIFAGDFNYNTYAQAYKQYQPRGSTKPYNTLAQSLPGLQDAAQQHNATHLPTAYDTGYTRMDYVWFSPNTLTCTAYQTFPFKDAYEALIKHTKNGAAHRYHFSDHTTIRTAFTLQTPQQAVSRSLKGVYSSVDDLYTSVIS